MLPVTFISSDEDADDTTDDQAKILATSFKSNSDEEPAVRSNPLTTFDNPVYDLLDGKGLQSVGPDPESEQVKEDLSMIGKPLYEDDIEL